jgi:hypothetical protein
MGEKIVWNGREREIVKVKSNNPSHNGYYTTFRDAMGPDDVEYIENEPAKDEPKKEAKPAEPAKPKRKSKKEV